MYQTLQTFMGGALVNYFTRFGRQWQVYVQAEGSYRTSAENLGKFYVNNANGRLVPLSALTGINTSGPEYITRYNQFQAVQINGRPRPATALARLSPPSRMSSRRPCRCRWAMTGRACPTRK